MNYSAKDNFQTLKEKEKLRCRNLKFEFGSHLVLLD